MCVSAHRQRLEHTWGYIVAVSGAELEERLDFRGTLGVDETPPDQTR